MLGQPPPLPWPLPLRRTVFTMLVVSLMVLFICVLCFSASSSREDESAVNISEADSAAKSREDTSVNYPRSRCCDVRRAAEKCWFSTFNNPSMLVTFFW